MFIRDTVFKYRFVILPLLLALLVASGLFWRMSLSSGASFQRAPAELDWSQDLFQTLDRSWSFYKSRYLISGERVQSANYGGTITEGQSYALLKSVWMDDPATFAKVWQWTRQNMQRHQDHLFGWRWGQRSDGAWGLMDDNNATDADEDIAYALLQAGERWHQPQYIQSARLIIADLWKTAVIPVHGHLYFSPGTWEAFRQEYFTLNPSYFAPYVYRKFARYDLPHAQGWNQLAQDIYPTLEACSNLTVTKLPPNWCAVTSKGSIIFSDKQGEGARDFSYDAFRVFWRMGMDAGLGSPAAKAYLQNHQYLLTDWQRQHRLPEGFTSLGVARGQSNSGFALSAALAQSHWVSPSLDKPRYDAMLAPDYHHEGYWFDPSNDFLQSVIWLHLYTLTSKPH